MNDLIRSIKERIKINFNSDNTEQQRIWKNMNIVKNI